MLIEAANILRRAALAGDIAADAASLATAISSICGSSCGRTRPSLRGWELRENVTVYDGTFVALAELLDVHLATLMWLADAPGPRCRLMTSAGR